MPDPTSMQFNQIRSLIGSPNSGNNSSSLYTPPPALGGGGGAPVGAPGTGGGSGPGGVQPESVSGDSLTQFIRSLTNLGGTSASSMLGAGANILGQGLSTTNQGLSLFNSPVAYYNALLSGNQEAMTQAIAPTAEAIGSQYGAAEQSASTSLPRGGYRSTTLANLPFQKAQQIGDLYAPLQANAAAGLSGIAGDVAGIGTQVAGIGTQEQGLGLQSLFESLQAQLQRRGQDMGVGSFGSQFSQIAQALQSLI
jgi:hypothetical protein